LIRAFDRLCDQGLPHLLVLTGKLGWKTHGVVDAIAESPYKHRIILTGFVNDEDLPGLYRGADVFAYPSFYEGFGLPPLEAMACGTPVVASRVSSIPEVVGDAGILVSPEDEKALAAGLWELVRDSDKNRAIVNAGLGRSRGFTWQRCVEETVGVYRDIAGVYAQS
jgi:glycosyltransferase involved in cell wall biosynthesis